MPTTGTTTQRGYGWKHQKVRQRLLRQHTDGTHCPGCHHPMYRNPNRNHDHRPLEADHTKDLKHHGPGDADRLLCSTCNRRRGAGHDERLTPGAGQTTNTTGAFNWGVVRVT